MPERTPCPTPACRCRTMHRMTDIVDPALEAYAEAHTTAASGLPRGAGRPTSRATLDFPGMMVGPLEGRFLEMLVFALGARRVLEIGTFGGYSALAMAAGLAPGGSITTCEIDPRPRRVRPPPHRRQPLRRPDRGRGRAGRSTPSPSWTAPSTWSSSTPTRPATPPTSKRCCPSWRRGA